MSESTHFNVKTAVIGVLCVVLGFLAGFFFANAVNREEQNKLRAEVASLRANSSQNSSAGGQQAGGDGRGSLPTLTEAQLKNAVAQADESPSDMAVQNRVGQALYFYALEKGNAQILPEVARILRRAHSLDPKNFRTVVLAGDAHFLMASQSGDAKQLGEARRFYEAALALQPDDAQVRTNLGRTYFYDKPSDARRAIAEYRRALQTDPREELAVQSLAAALIETGGYDEAARLIEELEKLNPSNTDLANLRAQLEQKRNAAKE